MIKNNIFETLVGLCKERGIKISTAESCTGGMIASGIVCVSGASDIFEKGWITYSDKAKNEVLGVPWKYLKKYTAVSPMVAGSMAMGARAKSGADIAISTTGYAGPDGESVGLVYIGVSTKEGTKVRSFKFRGDRQRIRSYAAKMAVSLALREILK